jgi:hypothetical protein
VHGFAPSASTPRRVGAWLLLALAAVWIVDLALAHGGVPDLLDDTWEYAVSARHLLAGDGFVTSVIHPPLWTLRDTAMHVPLLIHGPLLPALFAGLIASFGPGIVDHTAWLAAGFAVLAGGLTYRLGKRLAGGAVGVAAALLYTLSPRTIEAVHHDVAIAAGAALFAASLAAIVDRQAGMRLSTRRAGAAGALLGLGYLVRPEFLFVAPLLALAAGRRAWATFGAFALVALPWWVHHAVTVGSPFFNLSAYMMIGYRPAAPGLSVLRDFDIAPRDWPWALRQALPALPDKWMETAPHAFKRALFVPGAGTGLLAALGGLAALRSARLRRIAAWSAAVALLPVAIMTLTLYDERYLGPFVSLWAIAAAFGAATLAERLPDWMRAPRVWTSLLLLIALPSAAGPWRAAAEGAAAARATLEAERRALEPLTAAGAESPRLMFSDTPDFTAWTTRRPVVWLTREDYEALPDCRPPAGVQPPQPAAGGALPAELKESDAPTMRMLPCRGEASDTRFHP